MAGRSREVSDEEILREILLSPDPVVTTSEISGQIEMSRQGIHKRFKELREEGYLRKKKVGANAVVWWLSDKGQEKAARERS